MPALSPTMEEGKLAKWLKKVGDNVKSGDVIAEIETDKATMEVEAVDEGTLSAILVPEGTENVKVNTPIAVIGEGERRSRCAERRSRSQRSSEAEAGTRRRQNSEAAAKAPAVAPAALKPIPKSPKAPKWSR